jgi:hypothetical protein
MDGDLLSIALVALNYLNLIMALLIIAPILIAFVRETNCRHLDCPSVVAVLTSLLSRDVAWATKSAPSLPPSPLRSTRSSYTMARCFDRIASYPLSHAGTIWRDDEDREDAVSDGDVYTVAEPVS